MQKTNEFKAVGQASADLKAAPFFQKEAAANVLGEKILQWMARVEERIALLEGGENGQ